MNTPTDIRQVKIPTIAVGLILSVAVIAGTITWSSARTVARIDRLEESVEAIEDSMDMNAYARVEDIRELEDRLVAMEEMCNRVDEMEALVAGIASSVSALLMEAEQDWWPDADD
jgi:tetrahydromethanopterin S-methyltransferase subunit B